MTTLKIILYLIFMMTISLRGFSQNKLSFCYNDSIKYSFGLVGMKLINMNEVIPSKYIVVIDLNEEQAMILKNITKNTWLELLKDTTTDWASNLLLYHLKKRDAIEFYAVIKNRKDWILLKKNKEDLKYWKKYLLNYVTQN